MNTIQLIHLQINASAPAGRTAGDGSGKPAGAKPTGHGVAGLRVRRHRYPDALCGRATRTCNGQPHGQPNNNNFNKNIEVKIYIGQK